MAFEAQSVLLAGILVIAIPALGVYFINEQNEFMPILPAITGCIAHLFAVAAFAYFYNRTTSSLIDKKAKAMETPIEQSASTKVYGKDLRFWGPILLIPLMVAAGYFLHDYEDPSTINGVLIIVYCNIIYFLMSLHKYFVNKKAKGEAKVEPEVTVSTGGESKKNISSHAPIFLIVIMIGLGYVHFKQNDLEILPVLAFIWVNAVMFLCKLHSYLKSKTSPTPVVTEKDEKTAKKKVDAKKGAKIDRFFHDGVYFQFVKADSESSDSDEYDINEPIKPVDLGTPF